MQHLPTVSIVLPIFNGGTFIGKAVKSMICQTYPHWQLIIINDGSTDDGPDIIRSFADSRIRLISLPENRGIVHALNKGIAVASGKYLARMDADDICDPTRLEKQVAAMEKNPDVVVIGSAASVINEQGWPTGQIMTRPQSNEDIKASLFFGCPFIHPSIMLRKSVLDKHGIEYESSIRFAQDYVLYTRLWCFGKMLNLPEPLLQYRLHAQPQRVTADQNKQEIVKGRILAWRNVLMALQNDCSEELLLIHDKFCFYPHTITKAETASITGYLDFLLGLLAVNKASGAFHSGAFRKYLSSQVKRVLVYPGLPFGDFLKAISACHSHSIKLDWVAITRQRGKALIKSWVGH